MKKENVILNACIAEAFGGLREGFVYKSQRWYPGWANRYDYGFDISVGRRSA
jgi:hypothetical protein